jgi:hypothetical protein
MTPADETFSSWGVYGEDGLISAGWRDEREADADAERAAQLGFRCVVVETTTTIKRTAGRTWEPRSS